MSALKALERKITGCGTCPRLREHCTDIAQTKRKSFADQTYWGRPVSGFGDPLAQLFILGLAPAAHGANRTGRVFTGDRSGDWLYRALHKAGFANQALSRDRHDGLKLSGAYVTATVKCAPPDNKPTPEEIENCLPFLEEELRILNNSKVFLALGKLAWDAAWNQFKKQAEASGPRPEFGHNKCVRLPRSGRWMLGSYHPSQQNTFTGKLTEPMFDAVFAKARKLLEIDS